MLHAFLRKGVRRILVVGKAEPARDGNEDGITAMVFGPLCFMSTPEAMRALAVAFGDGLAPLLRGRAPASHELLFWPGRLRAGIGEPEGPTRCEPDLVVVLTFDDGSRAAVVCEMKWDAPDDPATLSRQMTREREAVSTGRLGIPASAQLTVAVTKNRLYGSPAGVGLSVTWGDLEAALSLEGRTGRPGSPSRLWADLTAEFLREAKQSSYQGFGSIPDLSALADRPFLVFSEPA